MADSTKKTQIVKLHHLRPAPGAKTAKTRVGRGEGSKGKTAGRGTKGTKARYQVAAGFEGGQMPIHMRLPSFAASRTPSAPSTRLLTWTASRNCSPTVATSPLRHWLLRAPFARTSS